MDKPEIVFVFPAVMGGVSSFNFNIINNSNLIRNFYSKVILLHEESDPRPVFTEKFDVDESFVFPYSDKENQYRLQKRLNDLLGTADGAIVTDNGLTMEAATRFRNPKTIFSLIHDYYYVNQNTRLGDLADIAVAHSSFFSDAVFASDPAAFAGRSLYIPYGVKQLAALPEKKNDRLKIVFLGRLEKEKGVMLLYETERALQELNIEVDWTVIGKGSLKNALQEQWNNKKNISFFEPGTTEEVYSILGSQDIFLFPTSFEGTPVSILEGLANGVVPIVNDLPGGIRDIVTASIGFRCTMNSIKEYAQHISALHHNRERLAVLQQNCFRLANTAFDVEKNADNYFERFAQYAKLKRPQPKIVRHLKGLDRPFFGYLPVKMIRKFK